VPQYSRRVARGTAHSRLDCAELWRSFPGRAIAENGNPDRGIALAMQALAAMQAIQSRHFLCYLLGLPADACPKAGRHAEAMKAVEDGLVVAEVHTNGQDRAATRSSGSTRKLRMRAIAMKPYSIRGAKREEQRALTRLIVRATLHSGYDDAFIDRARPGLTISLNGIVTGNVQVAEQSGEVIGVVEVLSTVLQGIAVLGIFVDPAHWKKGVGRALFETAIARARTLKVGALMIYASPFAEGFYCRLGAIRIGEGPFVYSPEVILSHFLFIVPPAEGFVADKNSN